MFTLDFENDRLTYPERFEIKFYWKSCLVSINGVLLLMEQTNKMEKSISQTHSHELISMSRRNSNRFLLAFKATYHEFWLGEISTFVIVNLMHGSRTCLSRILILQNFFRQRLAKRKLAIMMALHPRLGKKSLLSSLKTDILSYVASM